MVGVLVGSGHLFLDQIGEGLNGSLIIILVENGIESNMWEIVSWEGVIMLGCSESGI